MPKGSPAITHTEVYVRKTHASSQLWMQISREAAAEGAGACTHHYIVRVTHLELDDLANFLAQR